jgi:hypothetical protein
MASHDRQTFGSALRQPWALARIGSNCPPGRRPATEIVYLTDDEGDWYLGGTVSFYRARGRLVRTETGFKRTGEELTPRWHYSYKRAKRIAKADVLHIFPSTDKSTYGGPLIAEVRRARKALPITPEDSQ